VFVSLQSRTVGVVSWQRGTVGVRPSAKS